jgi:hypothetical protein
MCDAFLDRNTKILVQCDKPVLFRRLLEQRALDGHGVSGKNRSDCGMRDKRRRKALAGGNIE